MSIAEAIKLARERNPTFAMAHLSYESARLTHVKTLHELGWVESFTSSTSYDRNESFDYKIYNTATSRRSTFTKSKKMDTKTSWKTTRTRPSGMTTDFYTTLNTNRTQTHYKLVGQAESLTDAASSKYRYTGLKMNPEIGMTVKMPFMGEGKRSGEESRRVAEAVWAQAETDYDDAKRQVVLAVQQGYYDLLKSRELTRLRKRVLAESEQRLDVTKKRLSVGLGTELDVSNAELDVLNGRADLTDAVFSEQQSLGRFNSLIGLPLEDYYDLSDTFLAKPVDELTLKWVRDRVVSQSNSLKRMDKDIEQYEIELTQARRKLEPTLALTSTVAMEGERRTFRDVVSDPEPKYNFALAYDFPFGEKVSEKTDVDLAQATLSSKEIERKELSQGLILDATETYQQILKTQQRLAIARQSTEVSRRSLTIAQAKYEEGRSEITDVIGAKESVVGAQETELNELYSLAVAIAQLEVMIGDL